MSDPTRLGKLSYHVVSHTTYNTDSGYLTDTNFSISQSLDHLFLSMNPQSNLMNEGIVRIEHFFYHVDVCK